jgi:hypothetical protein
MLRVKDQRYPIRETWFDTVDSVFSTFFLVELVARLIAFRINFLINSDKLFNWFDFVIVSISNANRFTEIGINANVLRVVRLCRLLRMFRAIKALTMFMELQHYLVTLTSSLKVALWAVLIFAFGTFLAALTCVEFMLSLADHNDPAVVAIIQSRYNGIDSAMLSMVYSATGGLPWGLDAMAQGELVPMVRTTITMYVMVNVFVLFPIVHGEFVLKILEIRNSDSNLRMSERMEHADFFIRDFCKRSRASGYSLNDRLDCEGLDEYMKRTEIEHFMMANQLELVASEVLPIFDDQGDGLISVKEFIYGCQWLKTVAKPTDSLYLSEQLETIRRDAHTQKDKVSVLSRRVEQLVDMFVDEGEC